MADVTVQVMADQADEMAQKVVRLELQMAALVKMLSAKAVTERCGFDEICIGNLKDPVRAILAKSQHSDERRKRIAHAEREGAITRMIDDRTRRERFRDLTGEELADDYNFATETNPRLKTK